MLISGDFTSLHRLFLRSSSPPVRRPWHRLRKLCYIPRNCLLNNVQRRWSWQQTRCLRSTRTLRKSSVPPSSVNRIALPCAVSSTIQQTNSWGSVSGVPDTYLDFFATRIFRSWKNLSRHCSRVLRDTPHQYRLAFQNLCSVWYQHCHWFLIDSLRVPREASNWYWYILRCHLINQPRPDLRYPLGHWYWHCLLLWKRWEWYLIWLRCPYKAPLLHYSSLLPLQCILTEEAPAGHIPSKRS